VPPTAIIRAVTETYDFPFGDLAGIVEVRKSDDKLSIDQRGEADRIDNLAHALADHFGRKVVLVWPDDQEFVIEPRPELRLED
jgi:hypothetical protein